MKKYGGTLVHKLVGTLGDIEVVEDLHYLSLHFGSEATQSRMDKAVPHRLVLGYTRAMTAGLLLNPEPQRILLVGLGGGSLAKFFHHYFPQCHIDAVEYSPEVCEVARSHFYLPDDGRIHLHIDDGGHFLRTADLETFADYDLILVDAFEARNIAYSVCGLSFYDACRDRLSANGILSINLWSGDWITAPEMLDAVRTSFNHQVLKLNVEGKANIIGLAMKQPPSRQHIRLLSKHAMELQRRYDIEYPALLRTLRQLNPHISLV